MLGTALGSHVLFTAGGIGEIWPIFAAGGFLGGIAWVMYAAVEPIGRRVWPTMFVSLSRLLSRPRMELRDPLLGRSVLIGLVAGAILAVRWVGPAVIPAVRGGPPHLLSYDLSFLLGLRASAEGLLGALIVGLQSFLLVALLVVLRLIFKRSWPAVAIAVVVWPVLWGATSPLDYAVNAAYALVALTVLLRAGVLALLVATMVMHFVSLASVPEWSAWYGQTAKLAVTVTAALAVFGVWAAVSGSRGTHPAAAEGSRP